MSARIVHLPPRLHDYILSVCTREPPVLRALREETAAMPQAHYQIGPDEGQLLTFLIELLGARRCLDIGTFTGYSALAMALAMPAEGRVVSFDVSEAFADIAWRYWHEAGVADKIAFVAGPATEGLQARLDGGEAGTYDVAFIDADKESYSVYYELSLALLRPGGIVAIDNTLWRGRVVDPKDTRARTEAVRRLNQTIHADARVTPVLLPLSDGVTLARKRRPDEPAVRAASDAP
ncbi:MAG: SAM-dependent methyltransferase [Alphaproteobacteria bacterium]|nr:SAM-dependent methyltransferase [Alphaproteobacteria bacterium]